MAAQEHLGEDPKSGALFVFVNKRKNHVKVLWFERNGYCLLYKRLRALSSARTACDRHEIAGCDLAWRGNLTGAAS